MNQELKIGWFTPKLVFMAFFCVLWDGFLVFWYAIALSNIGTDDFSWLMLLFPLLHVAAGTALTYTTIAGFVNSTILKFYKTEMSIEHGPIPWIGNKTIIASDLENLVLDYDRNSDEAEKTMIVSAHHIDGHQIVLFNHLDNYRSHYVAWQMANALGLPLVRKDLGMTQPPFPVKN